jgi:hypothetical protein
MPPVYKLIWKTFLRWDFQRTMLTQDCLGKCFPVFSHLHTQRLL